MNTIKKLSLLILCFAIAIGLVSCSQKEKEANLPTTKQDITVLPESEDRGMNYIDSFIFVGESTTYHLKSRGVLSGGKKTNQVWANASGTLNMSLIIDKTKIIYPETGEELTFFEAAKRKQPEYILLTFGLNGAVQNIKKGKEYYKTCYRKLINSIKEGSPNTKIILGSAFPVSENIDMSTYSITLPELNEYIDIINTWTYELAEEEGCRYLAMNEILKDSNNNLKISYQIGDGIHLNTEAYRQILMYIRTHGYV